MELAGFVRVKLCPGEQKRVRFEMKVTQLAFLNEEMKWLVEKGTIKLLLGNSCRNIFADGSVEITEDAVVDERTRGFYAKADVIQ